MSGREDAGPGRVELRPPGRTAVMDAGAGWALVLRLVPSLMRGPLVRELRVLPLEDLPADLAQRVAVDGLAWAQQVLHEGAYESDDAPGAGVTAALLQRLPQMIRRCQIEYGHLAESEGWTPESGLGAAPAPPARYRPGVRGHGEAFYAGVAAAYVRLIAAGERSPVEALAAKYGRERDTVDGWLRKARKHGLLTSVGRGSRGGQLTDKALEVLREREGFHGMG